MNPHLFFNFRTGAVAQCVVSMFCTLACSNDAQSPAPSPEPTEVATTSDGAESAPPIDTTPHTYEADDERLQFSGRIDWSDPKAPTFALGGTRLTARFSGTGLAVNLEDEFRYSADSRNWMDVFVDGVFTMKFAATEDVTRYDLAKDLPVGEHTVVLAKRTEPNIGKVTVTGVEVAGTLIDPAPALPHKMIAIGDSITAGSGAEAKNNSEECTEDAWNETGGSGWGQPYHNANVSYAAVAAAELGAEVHIVGVSGIGLVRNYSSMYDARPMPEVYDLLYPELEDSPAYDLAQFIPDVVVVALGTNDFSPGDNPPEDPREHMEIDAFTTAYIAFVDHLRDVYSDAFIVLGSSPMLGNGWPNAEDTFRQDQLDAIAATVAHYTDAGDDKVVSFEAEHQAGRGCGTHPNVEQQAETGTALAARIREVTGWTE